MRRSIVVVGVIADSLLARSAAHFPLLLTLLGSFPVPVHLPPRPPRGPVVHVDAGVSEPAVSSFEVVFAKTLLKVSHKGRADRRGSAQRPDGPRGHRCRLGILGAASLSEVCVAVRAAIQALAKRRCSALLGLVVQGQTCLEAGDGVVLDSLGVGDRVNHRSSERLSRPLPARGRAIRSPSLSWQGWGHARCVLAGRQGRGAGAKGGGKRLGLPSLGDRACKAGPRRQDRSLPCRAWRADPWCVVVLTGSLAAVGAASLGHAPLEALHPPVRLTDKGAGRRRCRTAQCRSVRNGAGEPP
mmetsp:Transcript_76/g.249  ORF Transcript_76/g.249 Transcript_76/m.249 type:complete len:299 (-) Transcript_76:163-1059(-)